MIADAKYGHTNPRHRDLLYPGTNEGWRLSEQVQAEIAFGQSAEGVFHCANGMVIFCLAM